MTRRLTILKKSFIALLVLTSVCGCQQTTLDLNKGCTTFDPFYFRQSTYDFMNDSEIEMVYKYNYTYNTMCSQ